MLQKLSTGILVILIIEVIEIFVQLIELFLVEWMNTEPKKRFLVKYLEVAFSAETRVAERLLLDRLHVVELVFLGNTDTLGDSLASAVLAEVGNPSAGSPDDTLAVGSAWFLAAVGAYPTGP